MQTLFPSSGARGWRRDYRAALRDEFDALAGELSPATVYVTILWRSQEFVEYLQEVLRTLDESLHDSFRPIFVTDVPAVCESLSTEFNAPVLEMPMQEFTRGVQQVVAEKRPLEASGEITAPFIFWRSGPAAVPGYPTGSPRKSSWYR